MTLQRKRKCHYHIKEFALNDRYIDRPSECPWCEGKLEVDHNIIFEHHVGIYKKVDWEKIDNYDGDVSISFNCQCGDRIFTTGDEDVACSCGRVYRFRMRFMVDETCLGKPEMLIEEDKQKEIARYKKIGLTDEQIRMLA